MDSALGRRWTDYLLRWRFSKELELATVMNERFPSATRVGQPDVACWRNGGAIPPQRLTQLQAFVQEQMYENLRCEPEPVYLCNLHGPYRPDRGGVALAMLREMLFRQLPSPVGGAAIFVYAVALEPGIGAQCIANRLKRPSVHFVLVESAEHAGVISSLDDLSRQQQTWVQAELRAHVFTKRSTSTLPTIEG